MNEQNTAVWERRLGEGLDALAESEAPAATVTVEDIIASGRRARQRRRGRGAFALTAMLITATALTFGALAIARHGGAVTPPAGHSPSPGGSASTVPGSDLAHADLAFGWLPPSLDGTNEISAFTPGSDFKAGAGSRPLPPGDGPGGTFLQAWASGSVSLTASIEGPGSGIGTGMSLSSAGTVAGHPAWWADGAPGSTQAASGGELMLYWQYEPNAWATVTYHGTTDTATGAMLLHVADTLVIGPTKPYALPFHMQSAPAGMHAFSFNINLPERQGSQYGDGALILCLKSPCNAALDGSPGGLLVSQQPTTWLGGELVTLNGAPMLVPGTNTPMSGPTLSHESVIVDGHPANLWTNATSPTAGATLTFAYDGTTVLISAAGAEYSSLGGETGFLGFCRSLTWLGPNPADWTVNVIG